MSNHGGVECVTVEADTGDAYTHVRKTALTEVQS
jgi:hypothetical protein